MSRRIVALLLGCVFAACAAYWFTIGRRPLEEAGDEDELAGDDVGEEAAAA